MDKKKSLVAILGAAFGLGAARAVDVALIGSGLATAAGAVGFAGYMVVAGNDSPKINGMQYLAIFAQPGHPPPAIAAARDLDMSPVGAIPPEQKTSVNGYALVGAKQSYAWLRQGNRIFAVRPGDDVPQLGHVATIALRDGRWTLLDDKGAPLIVSAVAEDSSPEAGRFDKRMIFGAGR